jgi:hypothetical protein
MNKPDDRGPKLEGKRDRDLGDRSRSRATSPIRHTERAANVIRSGPHGVSGRGLDGRHGFCGPSRGVLKERIVPASPSDRGKAHR